MTDKLRPAAEVAAEIEADLNDRRGMRWDSIDEDTCEGIREAHTEIVRRRDAEVLRFGVSFAHAAHDPSVGDRWCEGYKAALRTVLALADEVERGEHDG